MKIEDLKFKYVLYYMQSLVITVGSTSFEIPRAMVRNVQIDKRFDTMIYPMCYINAGVPLWFYTKMTQDPDNIYITMNLQYRLSDDTNNLTNANLANTTDLSGRFKVIIPYTTSVGDSNIQTKVEKEDKSYNQTYSYNESVFVELSLYNIEAYAASYNKLNAILSSTNLTNALTYCLNKSGIKNILLSKADNSQIYSEFKILPESGMKNIMRIIEDYKFHNDGSVVFFDLDNAYILSQKIACTAWRNNEYKSTQIINLSNHSEGMGNFSGIYIEPNEKTNILLIDANSFSSEKLDSAPLLKENAQTNFLKFSTRNATMNVLSPNKEFIVNLDSSNNNKNNGKYRMYSYNLNLTPSGEFLEPKFTVFLRK